MVWNYTILSQNKVNTSNDFKIDELNQIKSLFNLNYDGDIFQSLLLVDSVS